MIGRGLSAEWLDENRFLASFTIYFEGGLLMIDDVQANSDRLEWDSLIEPVHVMEGSIHVAVRTAGSGPVRIDVLRGRELPAFARDMREALFDDVLFPSGILELRDSDEGSGVVVRLEGERARVRILFDYSCEGEVDHVLVQFDPR